MIVSRIEKSQGMAEKVLKYTVGEIFGVPQVWELLSQC